MTDYNRVIADPEIKIWLKQRMRLLHTSSNDVLTTLSHEPNVVYLDSMYSYRKKCLSKKRNNNSSNSCW